MLSKDFRGSVRERLFCGELAELSNLILIGFILLILLYFNYYILFIIVTFFISIVLLI